MAVELGNGVTLDYDDTDTVVPQHYAFLVSDEEFDAIFARITEAGVAYWADPGHRQAGVINRRGGGRGFYFPDPDGHNLEVFTRPPLG
jgi:catechol 2,3-dioxygenase-like lactoylglutathione lyase family enzyme